MESPKVNISFEVEVPVIQCKECLALFTIQSHLFTSERMSGESTHQQLDLAKVNYCPICGEEQ